jgi:hypothetical protein
MENAMTEALTAEQLDAFIEYYLAERKELEARVLRYLADLDPNDMAAA